MRMYDLIQKKKQGQRLEKEELEAMISGLLSGEIPDYQMAAMLMAIYFQGMTDEELSDLTLVMARSGDMVDLSPIQGIKVDKHSTGGVGDKTTLVIAPIVAACGVKVAKMSGRGLGHTGGTVDKLESIPGFRTSIPRQEFFDIVNETGIAVIGQSGNLAPADKKLYALRDVTATIDSIPLIASSIMSKKLAAGSDGILLDVKTGSGAFMKTLEDSIELAKKMVAIGTHAGKRCAALITNMDIPLGNAIGNSLEVMEAVETLKGSGPDDLWGVCLELAANMLELADQGSHEECINLAKEAVESGRALASLKDMVRAQGGDPSYIEDTGKFQRAAFSHEVRAESAGYVTHINSEACGIASVMLGAGRNKKEDGIDFSAGILLHKKYGDRLEQGDVIATLFAGDEQLFEDADRELRAAYVIGQEPPAAEPLVYVRVTRDGVETFV